MAVFAKINAWFGDPAHPWRKVAGKVTRIVLGSILTLLGLVGLVLPFIPGWLLLIPGLLLLSRDTPLGRWLRPGITYLTRRFPRLRRLLHRNGYRRQTGRAPLDADRNSSDNCRQ